MRDKALHSDVIAAPVAPKCARRLMLLHATRFYSLHQAGARTLHVASLNLILSAIPLLAMLTVACVRDIMNKK